MGKNEEGYEVSGILAGAAAVGVIGILCLIFGVVQVIGEGEVGARLEFGKFHDVMRPGLNFAVPFMDDVRRLSTQVEKTETVADASSKDLQVVTANITVNYRIEDSDEAVRYLWDSFRGDHASRIINPQIQEIVKATTAKYTAEELITRRAEVKQAITAALKERMQSYHINVVEVAITNLDFSAQFNQAIEAKVTAEQLKQKAQIELEQTQIEVQKEVASANATAMSQVLRAQADAQAQVLRANASAESRLLQANAEAEAVRKINQQLSPEYVQYSLYQLWDGHLPQVSGIGGNSLFDMTQFISRPSDWPSGASYSVVNVTR